MKPRVLFVDDDTLLLSAIGRSFWNRYELVTAESGPAALDIVRRSPPFAVVVADMMMPGMDGITFLKKFAEISSLTTRIMLTGEARLDTAMEAVNHGQVFRFLTKPCDEENFGAVIDVGIRQYQLVTAEKSLLEDTLSGSVQILVELLSVFDPKAFGLTQKVREYALKLASAMNLPAPWDLGLAALLCRIGKLAIPMELHAKVSRGERLTLQETEVFRMVPEYGRAMVTQIPRLQSVARFILYSTKDYDGEGYPVDGIAREDLPLESRILKVATDFVEQSHIRKSKPVVVAQMKTLRGKYDPAVLAALDALVNADKSEFINQSRSLLGFEALRIGMVLAGDLFSDRGFVVLPAGTRLSAFHIERLRSLGTLNGLEEPILVSTFDFQE